MENTLEKIKREKLVAIIRADSADQLEKVVDSLYAGGVRVIEITLNTDGALEAIRSISGRNKEILIGAGTVLDRDQAKAAIEAGAQFLLAPTLDKETIEAGNEAGVPVIPGIMTPTEALHAYRWGAKMVKVFPAKSVGINFAKDIHGPMPFIDMMAVGGISPDNLGDYLNAGWASTGIGTSLVNQKRIDEGKFDEIEQSARQFIAAREQLK